MFLVSVLLKNLTMRISKMKTVDMYKKGSSVVGEGELVRIELEMTEKEYAEFQRAYCPECESFNCICRQRRFQ